MLDLALQLPIGLNGPTVAAGEKVAAQIGASEWLGPLAPVAMSPFFGLATLSGIATYGPNWLQQRSALLGDSSPLNSPALFWTLATHPLVRTVRIDFWLGLSSRELLSPLGGWPRFGLVRSQLVRTARSSVYRILRHASRRASAMHTGNRPRIVTH